MENGTFRMLASTSGVLYDTPKSTPATSSQTKTTSTVKRFALRSSGPVTYPPVAEAASLDRTTPQPAIHIVPITQQVQLTPQIVQQPIILLQQLPLQPPVAQLNNNIVVNNNDSDSEDEMADHSAPLLANFTGTSGQNAIDWLASLTEYCTYKQFDNAKRLSFFKLKLADIAKVWLLALPAASKDTFDHLSAAFLDRFQPRDAERHRLVRDLFSIKQANEETVDAYLSKLLRRAQQCGVDNAMTIHAAIGGLRPEVSNFCLERNPTTFEELIAAARLGEMTRPATSVANGVFNVQMETLTEQVSKMNEKMSQLTTASINKEQPERNRYNNRIVPQRQQNQNRSWPNRPGPSFNQQPRPTYAYRPNQSQQFRPQRNYGSSYNNSRPQTTQSSSGPCTRCAYPKGHPPGVECFHKFRSCDFCHKVGHSIRACRARLTFNRQQQY